MSAQEFAVRPALPADMAGCAAVVNGWIDDTPWFPRVVDAETVAEMLDKAPLTRTIWVVGDPVAAYLSLDEESNHIGALYCRTPGRGHGKALLDQAKAGRDALSLNTHVVNTRAQAFYTREGFAPAGERAPEPPETLTELRMEWRR